MYERMLCKECEPTPDQIEQTLGSEAFELLTEFESFLNSRYDVNRTLKFPFGNNYGWGYKYSHRSTHLCYALFERGAFTVLLQIGDSQVPKLLSSLPNMTPKTRDLWEQRYPCGQNGGWMHYRVTRHDDLRDINLLIEIRKPIKKKG